MALLRPVHHAGPASLRKKFAVVLTGLIWLLVGTSRLSADAAPSREYQVKAVFLFNFLQFAEWPPSAFADGKTPIQIGILGENPFGTALDETVRNETVGG